jgi:UDP-N-acetylglucosamine 3-dehydrogenase
MDKLNVAVLGCGFWGKNHARVFDQLECSNLVAVADLDEKRAKDIGEKHKVEWFNDPAKVIMNNNVDFVSICTPTITHGNLAFRSIEAGKHVLVEKPMTDTVKEAEKILSLSRKNQIEVMVGFIERFNPAVQKAKELIKNGEIGDIVLLSSKRVSQWPTRIGDVGVIKDTAIHDIDIICNLIESNVKQVYAVTGNLAHKYEDYANIILKFQDGRSAFIEANWLTPRKIRTLNVTGTEGLIQVKYIPQEVTLETKDMTYSPIFKQDEPLKLELQHFIKCILKGEKPIPSGQDGLKTLIICEAALSSAKTSNPINL